MSFHYNNIFNIVLSILENGGMFSYSLYGQFCYIFKNEGHIFSFLMLKQKMVIFVKYTKIKFFLNPVRLNP